ncbi:Cleavage and polyadenylation specificity factor subunit 3 [Caenorhabditis elegans]|uniref:Cleavage and polyadenylation specificity factor subunit 3 n=1 Tax=Caenorhabditis elegans TaxID=6239 RepID=Q95PY8_CAEEL|nr:Cleavage and polyadenylation specificity factor subunit 3 [Caenorhabditis elegans]CAC44310.2 Cleavage and polyadenylation specificity factor subunit 3 [Caenorhabditis elegans]|eukprot:NP_502553.2 Cleavage and Polyadenylation Specificity Factor [Caenorhabditis elegans]
MEEEGDNSDSLCFTPLGSGQEVGRSCHLLEYKGKRVMLDCGVHPGLHGVDALPFVDFVEIENIDLLLITHFHLDHCGALPWLLQKTAFQGKCFMTHATKAIYRMLLGDYVRISKYGGPDRNQLYTEDDLEKSMAKIETIDFREQKEVNGIRFWPYVAGHVLGACQFMIEIAGVRVLYTGDFSCLEDRHLCAAEIPPITPQVLITESTYGTQTHEDRAVREKRFTQMVHDIVTRGGRCLIPAFAIGPAQELMLILDEYWESHQELHDIPVYYASSLAKKCMSVYQTFVNGMNSRIQKQIAVKNPFIFKHVSTLRGMDQFEDAGPCVVLATPGMLQSGFSRELFESWCPDTKNGCIIAGYCVEGTLAKHILSEPEEIVSLSGEKLPMRMQVGYVSFSAHTDYHQTSNFVKALKPPHLVLVHGELHEMSRLKSGIERQFQDDNIPIEVHNPRNTERLQLQFRGEKTAKVIGKLAQRVPENNETISGVLVKNNFSYSIMVPEELGSYTSLRISSLEQRMSVHYSGSLKLLIFNLQQLNDDACLIQNIKLKEISKKGSVTQAITVFQGKVNVTVYGNDHVVVVRWDSNPVYDMYADSVVAAILHAQANPVPDKYLPSNSSFPQFNTAIEGMVKHICGDDVSIVMSERGLLAQFEEDGRRLLVEGSSDGPVMMGGDDPMDDPTTSHLLQNLTEKMRQIVTTNTEVNEIDDMEC